MGRFKKKKKKCLRNVFWYEIESSPYNVQANRKETLEVNPPAGYHHLMFQAHIKSQTLYPVGCLMVLKS